MPTTLIGWETLYPTQKRSTLRNTWGAFCKITRFLTHPGSLKPNKSKLFVLGETNRVVLTRCASFPKQPTDQIEDKEHHLAG